MYGAHLIIFFGIALNKSWIILFYKIHFNLISVLSDLIYLSGNMCSPWVKKQCFRKVLQNQEKISYVAIAFLYVLFLFQRGFHIFWFEFVNRPSFLFKSILYITRKINMAVIVCFGVQVRRSDEWYKLFHAYSYNKQRPLLILRERTENVGGGANR